MIATDCSNMMSVGRCAASDSLMLGLMHSMQFDRMCIASHTEGYGCTPGLNDTSSIHKT